MSEEEKEAIKTVEDLKTMKWYSHAFDNGTEILTEEKSDIDIVLNLIVKQQKEIEELNILLKQQSKDIGYMVLNYTSDDKIKAKIEELDKEEKQMLKGTKGQDRYAIKQEYMHKRSVLQSLLEKED